MKRGEEEGERYNHKWRMPKSLQASPLDSQEIPSSSSSSRLPKSALTMNIFRALKCMEALVIKTLKMLFYTSQNAWLQDGALVEPRGAPGAQEQKAGI